MLKDHEIAQLVNQLRDVAIEFNAAQQLRERIARLVLDAIKKERSMKVNTEYVGTPGTVGILNVGDGDVKLSFDPNNPAERIRAARIVKDMIRRGYALLIEQTVNDKRVYVRVYDFDENTCEYIIADFDPVKAANVDAGEQEQENEAGAAAPAHEASATKRKKTTKRIAADSTAAVSVPRTAGG